MLGSLFCFGLPRCWDHWLLRFGFLQGDISYASFENLYTWNRILTSASLSQSSSQASGTPPLFMLQSVVVRKIDYEIDSISSSFLGMDPVLTGIVKVGPANSFGVV
jgi:hypothetical protein